MGRALHGARGLKYNRNLPHPDKAKSRPARGAWIEILHKSGQLLQLRVAPCTGSVD